MRSEWTGLESASGLRPASAFVAIGAVFLVVAFRAVGIALSAGSQPSAVRETAAPFAPYDVVDRSGRPLAVSVGLFDLTVSPSSTWLAHTPGYMAERLAAAMEDVSASELLDRLLPPTPESGVIRVAPRLLRFGAGGASALAEWIDTGGVPDQDGADEREGRGRIEGLWIVPCEGDPPTWTLAWEPARTLSRAARERHTPGHVRRPEVWTRRLLDDLARLVTREPAAAEAVAALGLESRSASARREALREAIWDELMPCRFRVVRSGLDPAVAYRVSRLLDEEAVSAWQMRLEERLERRHPVRPRPASEANESSEAEPMLAGAADPRDAFSLLGSWGVLGAQAAEKRARAELGLDAEAPLEASARDRLLGRVRELEAQRRPLSGLELACARELERSWWDPILESGQRSYGRRMRVLPRDRRLPWNGDVPDYFEIAIDAPEVPRCVSTLDARLQGFLHEELLALLSEHAAALAQGIVVDVETGDVLAADGVYAYPMTGFAPLVHTFTPGSTMKAVVMAAALDEGVVRPAELLPTHAPAGLVVRDGRGHARAVGEALGAPTEAFVSAETGIARSVNAILVQIGLRVPADVLRARLVALGYGARPATGLGPEARGFVPALEKGTWSTCYTHASVSFGHELSVTLWQHAAALASLARGGLHRPLRTVLGVQQHGRFWETPLAEPQRVFSGRACDELLDMLRTAAESGTGRHVATRAQNPEFAWVATKSGTTERVETERCLHVELPHRVRHASERSACSAACRAALDDPRRHRSGRRTCYTSSMCAIGRLTGDERTLLVLLVVDDPGSKEKFGADVAGPAAMAVLRGAFGLDPRPSEETEPRPSPPASAFNDSELPWAEGMRG